MSGFRRLPSWWIRDEHSLKRFKGGMCSGASIAALKCLLAIVLMSEFSTQRAKVSYSDLMALTGLSRPMISRAISKLEREGIVEVCREGYINVYKLLVGQNDSYWAKVPHDRVNKALSEIPNRGEAPLAALKIYIMLLASRWNKTREVLISYDNLRDLIGVQKFRIRSGLDILFSHLLLHVKQAEGEHTHNIYTILGDLRMQ